MTLDNASQTELFDESLRSINYLNANYDKFEDNNKAEYTMESDEYKHLVRIFRNDIKELLKDKAERIKIFGRDNCDVRPHPLFEIMGYIELKKPKDKDSKYLFLWTDDLRDNIYCSCMIFQVKSFGSDKYIDNGHKILLDKNFKRDFLDHLRIER